MDGLGSRGEIHLRTSDTPVDVVSVSKSEPYCATWSFPRQINLTFGRRAKRLHQDPVCGGGGPVERHQSAKRLFRSWFAAVRPAASARTDQARGDFSSVGVYPQAAFCHGPLGDDTSGHIISRASPAACPPGATMAVFLRRPPLRLAHSSNRRGSAEYG